MLSRWLSLLLFHSNLSQFTSLVQFVHSANLEIPTAEYRIQIVAKVEPHLCNVVYNEAYDQIDKGKIEPRQTNPKLVPINFMHSQKKEDCVAEKLIYCVLSC